MNINREELAWAAGFFDGEGSFNVHSTHPSTGRKYARASINQVHPEVLERFKNAVLDIGNVTGPHAKGNKRQPIYTYAIQSFEGVQAVYALLYPFLSSVKREQGRKILEVCHRPMFSKDVCRNGHKKTSDNLTKYGQCRQCMRDADKRRVRK